MDIIIRDRGALVKDFGDTLEPVAGVGFSCGHEEIATLIVRISEPLIATLIVRISEPLSSNLVVPSRFDADDGLHNEECSHKLLLFVILAATIVVVANPANDALKPAPVSFFCLVHDINLH
jgi:hypothetical protein